MMRATLSGLLMATLLGLAGGAAAQTPSPALVLDVATLRQGLAGAWSGKLEYLDYSAERWFGLPMQVRMRMVGDGVTLLREAQFDDGPKTGLVWISSLALLDPQVGMETVMTARKGRGTTSDTYSVRLAAPARDATHWTIVSETTGRDGDSPARLRETLTRDGDTLTTLKEVDLLDDVGETWIQRNRSRLDRTSD